MPDDIVGDVTQPVASGAERANEAFNAAIARLEDAIRGQGEVANNIWGHVQNMSLELAKLHGIQAAQEVPASAADVIHAEGKAAENVLEGAADVGAAPAEVFVTKRKGFRHVRQKA